jgi:transcriptional regulator with XRE-family HTH domain
MKERSLTLDTAASVLGVERETVWRWTNGVSVPGLESAHKAQDAMGIPPKLWLEWSEWDV